MALNRSERRHSRFSISIACMIAVSFIFISSGKAQAHPAPPHFTTVELEPSHSSIHWTLDDVIHTVSGTFSLTKGVITFDPITGEAQGEIIVDATSGRSGDAARDRRMHERVLNSSRYRTFVFIPSHVSGKLDFDSAHPIAVDGTIRIHGETHPLQLDVYLHNEESDLEITTDFDVPYVQWGLPDPSMLFLRVSKTVHVHVEATGKLER